MKIHSLSMIVTTGKKFLALLLIVGSLSAVSAKDGDHPNIVLVMADDQGWGQVGYNGHPTLKTPNLDAMAAAGIRFDRFYAGGSVCSPTRATILTGRTHTRTGVTTHGDNLCLQERTLPQALQKAGYATAHFGKWHLNGVHGPGVPVLADDPNHPGLYGFDEWLTSTNFFDLNPLLSREGDFEEFKGDSSDILVAEALEFIQRQKEAATPFLAVVWYGSPHGPMHALEQDRVESEDEELGHHLGEIVAIDRSVGALRRGLRDLEIEKDTLVWYCSDNGGLRIDPDACGTLRGNKGDFFEGGIRVPAILEWPGQIEAAIVDAPATTMDIFPTLVELLDLPGDSLLPLHDGESILPLLKGEELPRTHTIPFSFRGRTALIDGEFKLVNNSRKGPEAWQLFNLEKDPSEKRDLSEKLPVRFRKMRKEADRVNASVEASAAGKDYAESQVIQPPRGEYWYEMKAYQPHFEEFFQRREFKKYENRVPPALR
ncbi:MAG: sulfatase-like hydrolase/transferase [Verrucomicrobiales bacterium]|nr:sulfatase-like hydrolase/transferase [Verrucomicrobiales bacterium]